LVPVSVIIVAFNSSGTIFDCLNSLNKQTWNRFEVILVDNTPENRTGTAVESQKSVFKFPLAVLFPGINLGFPGANNYGLRQASGRYISLLNTDAIADPFWLEKLRKGMDSHPEVGICASKMIVYGENVIDSAGDGYATSLKGYKRGEKENPDRYNREEYVFGACAGATLYRREMIEKIGFLDSDFFLIHEDTDFNFRAQLAGWKVLYIPGAVVHHKVRSSIGEMSGDAVYYTLRNSEFVRWKNVPGKLLLRCLPELILGTVTEFIYFALKHKRLRLYFEAKRDALKALPKILRKRRSILPARRVGDDYLLSIMTPVWRREYLLRRVEKLLFH
jgi:GT2 family glycosyltransferase